MRTSVNHSFRSNAIVLNARVFNDISKFSVVSAHGSSHGTYCMAGEGLHETFSSERGSYVLYTRSYCSKLILKPPAVLNLSLTQHYHLRCFRFLLWVAELLCCVASAST